VLLGDVLYKESEWNKFVDWVEKEKGIEVKSKVDESKSTQVLAETPNLTETTDKEFDARKKALYQKVRARLGVDNLIGTHDKWTDEENTEEEELSCISMLHSILTYSNDHSIEKVMSDRYLQRYINELGEQRVRELAQQEIEEFANATINRNVHTDSEGVSYNSVTFRDNKN
jgi:predicted MPP superfamily phosphohydrolase